MNDGLAGLGRRAELDAELQELGDSNLTAGRVLAQHRGHWMVAGSDGGEPQLLTARGRLREQPPVTGDWVAVDAAGEIAAVLERRGTIVRRAAGEATVAQVLAANVDLALLTAPLPEPNEPPDGASGGARPGRRRAGRVGADQGRPRPRGRRVAIDLAREAGIVDAVAVSARERRRDRRTAHVAPRRATRPSCSARRAPGSRRSSTPCSARSAKRPGRSASTTGEAATRRSRAS